MVCKDRAKDSVFSGFSGKRSLCGYDAGRDSPVQQYEYGVYGSSGSFLHFWGGFGNSLKGSKGVCSAAGGKPVGLSVSCVLFPFLCMDFKVEPPSGYKEGNHSIHFGANDSVCMGDGMYIGEKRGQMAEDACLGHYAVKVKGIPSWERCGRSVR